MSEEDNFKLNLYEEVVNAMDLNDHPIGLTEQGEVVLEEKGAANSHTSIIEEHRTKVK